ncbi:hypothetical protein SES60163_03076 [Salmonella enterica subsp. salamae serovar 58:l,z13,z28:z6 str. 00-0163]|nr:hypothetical protein SES60163_03076 [Salmonella enterica subsp. salamae serovar 58:l,z13,z28:z6 str. 00-0163]
MLKNDLIVKTFLCDFHHSERQKNGYWHHFMLYRNAAQQEIPNQWDRLSLGYM